MVLAFLRANCSCQTATCQVNRLQHFSRPRRGHGTKQDILTRPDILVYLWMVSNRNSTMGRVWRALSFHVQILSQILALSFCQGNTHWLGDSLSSQRQVFHCAAYSVQRFESELVLLYIGFFFV